MRAALPVPDRKATCAERGLPQAAESNTCTERGRKAAESKYTSRVIRWAGKAVVPALAALLAACGSGSDSEGAPAPASEPVLYANGHTLAQPTSDPGTLTFETELLRLVNAHRVARGLNALVDSSALRGLARGHSRHMIEHRFFDHAAPESWVPGDRLSEAGIDWTRVGENIATGYATPQAVFEAWLLSPSHRENLEGEAWTHAGPGYAQDAAPSAEFPQAHYWTLVLVR